jgi:hypothetical protein
MGDGPVDVLLASSESGDDGQHNVEGRVTQVLLRSADLVLKNLTQIPNLTLRWEKVLANRVCDVDSKNKNKTSEEENLLENLRRGR